MIKRVPHLNKLLTHGEQCRVVGARARALRKQRGFSRRELAELSGVSSATISRFENDGTATISIMLKLASSLDALESFSKIFLEETYSSLEDFEKGAL